MASLAVERTAVAGTMASSLCAHGPLASSPCPSSVSMAGWSSQRRLHRLAGSAGGLTIGAEIALFAGGRVSSVTSVVTKSAASPLSNSNGNVLEFESEEAFNTFLEEAGDKLVVVDISTKTCGPCKMIYPKVVEMSLDYPDVVFLKINGDTSNDTRALMRKWGVRAVPNFRFYKNKVLVHSHTGAKVEELKTRLAEHYGQPAKVAAP
ncbi:uncharacterized protein [Physcomitrium patens]|uniref:Thioredoxin domain-containing protein n=1 Tax=Physcomitrium patens TaxID=3218 RepID=A0A2K1K3Z8_PHYPA|nr:thioredoxin F-type, chloroplastic-like [Physcomitrium patens]PNR48505.1 hypothetical protein PHYPA_012982 [Physcomitrium patens]|eukprot:XP_024384749.1 thioredoxin F-type, chloroplastic-like [Physcomitrella patens]